MSFKKLYNGLKTDGRRKANITGIWEKPGIYVIKENNKIVYIGIAKTNLHKTLYRHFEVWESRDFLKMLFGDRKRTVYDVSKANYIAAVYIMTSAKAEKIEKALIQKYKPRDNSFKYNDNYYTGELPF